jgi:hypothetical protein
VAAERPGGGIDAEELTRDAGRILCRQLGRRRLHECVFGREGQR